MSAAIDQKVYLQKYLSGSSGDKKKKKKKAIKGTGFKIIDDDIDLSKLRPLDGDELDILDQGEDAPQIAGIIDERPEEIRKLEDFKTTSKWRVVNQDDGFNSKLEIKEIKKDIKEVEKENEIIFGKMYSDSEDDQKVDSDCSPPRRQTKDKRMKPSTSKNSQSNSDSDISPLRKRSKNKLGHSDTSPPSKSTIDKRKTRKSDSDASPPRRKESGTSRQRYDSDESPPRKHSRTNDKSRNYDSDLSPPRRQGHKPKQRPRKPSRWGDFNEEDIQKRKSESTERSPKRSKKSDEQRKRHSNDAGNDSDISPPRKNYNRFQESNNKSPNRSKKYSPDRRDKDKYDRRKHEHKHSKRDKDRNRELVKDKRKSSDSDPEPPRKYRRNSDSPPPTNKKMARTLEGKKAGLQDAGQLKNENEAFRKREEEAFKKMTDEMSGRNAKAVSRKSKRETSEERQKQKNKAELQKQLDEKYKKWGKGLKQVEAQEARVQQFLHESAKPLARYADDRDLEGKLKDVEREGDPMLQYMREKRREKGELLPEKPKYKGNFPPNRFNIRPGYRWDGVDRSNGYEKKFFENQSKRKAQEEEAYKWSTEDL